jgi:hypothetical protein
MVLIGMKVNSFLQLLHTTGLQRQEAEHNSSVAATRLAQRTMLTLLGVLTVRRAA